MGLGRFGNGRIDRKRGEERSLFSSSSGSEEDEESDADEVDDESRVARPRLSEKDVLEEELEIECLLADRCSKTPSPKS
jgi:hypothetical protein